MKFFISSENFLIKPQIKKLTYTNEITQINFFLKQEHFFKFFINGSIKKGKKLFFFNNFSSIFFDIFFFIKKNMNLYAYEHQVLLHQISFLEYYNINFLLNWYIKPLIFFFFTNFWKPRKLKSKRKNKKQKLQKKFIVSRYFLKKTHRWKIMFKVLFLKLSNVSGQSLKIKLLKFFLDMILNYKKAWIYLFKLAFYKKILFP